MMRSQNQQSRALDDLCNLLISILRPPPLPPIQTHPHQAPPHALLPRRPPRSVSPVSLASLLLGVSLALVLCGSVTFMIGFLLMPWVLGIAMVLYFVGFLSNLSGMGKSIMSPPTASTSRSSPKEMPGQLFSKLPII